MRNSILVALVALLWTSHAFAGFSGPSTSTGSYTISFSYPGGVEYFLWESTNGTNYSMVQFGGGATSKSFTKTSSGTYYYKAKYGYVSGYIFGEPIIFYAYFGGSSNPTVVQVGVTIPPPSVPGAISGPTSNYSGSYTLSWGASTGATSYQLYEKINSGGWTLVHNASSTSKSFSGKANATYYYLARACSSSGCSGWTAKTVQVIRTPGVPGAISAPSSDSDGVYSVSWGAATGTVTKYTLQRQTNGGTWTTKQDVLELFRDETGMTTGTYGYRVRACNALSCSGYTSTASVDVTELANIASPAAIVVADTAGSAAYSIDVAGAGDSRIRVPIAVPAGVNGLAPSLALSYSSGGPRAEMDARRVPGVLGYGWSLAGISEIRRCRIGASGDVDSSTNDRVCLDGQPLIAVEGTSYWADGAQYRTERQSLVKVVGHGTGATAWFEVFRPDGGIAQYGDTAATRAIAMQGSVPYLWSLRRLEDAFSNELTISYETNPEGGTNYPLSIDYDGAKIEFFYELRSDTEALSYGGTEFAQTEAKRMVALNRIAVSMNGIDVREYRIQNASTSAEDYLHVEKVQTCGYDTSGTTTECLAPLSFSWIMDMGAPEEFTSAVSEVIDGVGASTQVDYFVIAGDGGSPLTYSEEPFGTFTSAPNTTPISASRRVVSELRRPDGLGGFQRTTYRYKDVPLGNDANRGFVGFSERRVTRHDVPDYDSDGTLTLRTVASYFQYRLDHPFIGQVSRQLDVLDQDIVTAAAKLRQQEQVWAVQSLHGGSVFSPYLTHRTVSTFEDGAQISASETARSVCFLALSAGVCPASGTTLEHPTQVQTTTRTGTGLSSGSFTPQFWGDVPVLSVTGELSSVVRTIDFENDIAEWVLGFATNLATTSDTPTASPVTQTEQRVRLAGTKRMQSGTRFPGDPDLELSVTNGYDLVGNLTQLQVVGQSVPTRLTAVGSYLDDRYPLSVTNAESHTTTFGYDQRFGATDAITDADGRQTLVTRDSMGRVRTVDSPDGTEVNVDIEACDASLCSPVTWAQAAIIETLSSDNVSTQTAPITRIYRDEVGREVLREVEAFDVADGWSRVETHYDNAGRTMRRSLPYFSVGGTPQYVEFRHEVEGRLLREERPDGGITITAIDGSPGEIIVTVTETVKTTGQSDATRVKRSLFDARGLLTSTTDAFGSADAITTTYTYDGALNLSTVTIDGIEVASMDYDAAGNRKQIDEVNTGLTLFAFDALGRLQSQTDANADVTTFDYDDLDRLIEQIDGLGTSGTITSTWTYDPLNATGGLASRASEAFTETLSYDTLGRLDQVSTSVTVIGFPGNGSFEIDYGYDNAGRHSTTDWPSGLTITNDYTALGYPSAVRQGMTVLETAETLDAFGQVTRTDYGNGLATDRSFDALGRLTSLETGSAAVPKSVQDLEYTWRSNSTLYQRSDYQGTTSTGDDVTETFSYDALDRLTAANTSQSGGSRVLSFGYDGFGNLTTKTSSVATDLEVTGYQYTNPHRLTSAVIDGVLNTFVYDAAGNTTRYNAATGDDTVLDYDARGQVEHITVGLTEDKFWYGPDGARFLKQATWDDGGTQETEWTLYLAGGAYEELHPESDPDVLYRQQVQVTETVLHRRTVDPLSTVVTTFEYSHRDHLGSVDKVTDEAGNVLSSLAFDPFGGRRDAAWTQELIPAGVVALLDGESTTKRGFTDHEHLDRTGFIHMNGRVYDPRIGRFTSPDPFVQSPTFSQSYNRYAYVFNDPLSRTDPSGLFGASLFRFSFDYGFSSARFNFFTRTIDISGFIVRQIEQFIADLVNSAVSDPPPDEPTTPVDQAPSEEPEPAPADPVDSDPVLESPPPSGQSPGSVDENNSETAIYCSGVDGQPFCLPVRGSQDTVDEIQRQEQSGTRVGGVIVVGVVVVVATAEVSVPTIIAGARGTVIGVTRHGVKQKINRQVRSADELDAIKNPLEVKPVKIDQSGRPSQRSIGRNAEVVRNPETGDIITVNPTSTQKAARLLRESENQ